jgi:CTP:molybdopterin cytidylyltransferase MocA
VKLAGLILAAGAGSRFGPTPKLLARLDGRPLLEQAIAAQVDPVFVVLGAKADEILVGLDWMGAQPVICPEWQEGIAASLRCGIEAVSGAERVILTLGDQRISRAVVGRFQDAPPGTRATYRGRPGHPVVLGPEEMAAAHRLTGDHGLRLVGGPTIECGDLCSGRDIDTPEDLHEAWAVARTSGSTSETRKERHDKRRVRP